MQASQTSSAVCRCEENEKENLRAAFDDGVLYERDVLDIPEDYYPTMFATAASNALALGVSIAYPAPQTIAPLMVKAFREALGLSLAAAIPTSENIEILLARADSHMLALASAVPELQDDRMKARLSVQPAAVVEEPKKDEEEENEEEEEEEEVSEEDAAAGLGALFG